MFGLTDTRRALQLHRRVHSNFPLHTPPAMVTGSATPGPPPPPAGPATQKVSDVISSFRPTRVSCRACLSLSGSQCTDNGPRNSSLPAQAPPSPRSTSTTRASLPLSHATTTPSRSTTAKRASTRRSSSRRSMASTWRASPTMPRASSTPAPKSMTPCASSPHTTTRTSATSRATQTQ